MPNEELVGQLSTSIDEVLESMCFTMVDGEAECGSEESIPRVEVRLNFRGSRTGEFWLSIPTATAQELAAAFSGAPDTDDLLTGNVVSELANMICGATLSRVADRELFELDTPSAHWVKEGSQALAPYEAGHRIDLKIGKEVISAAITIKELHE